MSRLTMIASVSAASVLAACSTTPPFPAAESGPLNAEELAFSFDSAVDARLIRFTRADRACALAKASEMAAEAGEPDPSIAENQPSIMMETSGGLKTLPQAGARELAAARIVGEAANACQVEGNE